MIARRPNDRTTTQGPHDRGRPAAAVLPGPSSVLLLGASGYVGAACVRAFVRAGRGEGVTCAVRSERRAAEVRALGATRVETVATDFVEAVPALVRRGGFDCVVNCAVLGRHHTRAEAEVRLVRGILAALASSSSSSGGAGPPRQSREPGRWTRGWGRRRVRADVRDGHGRALAPARGRA